MIHRDVPYDAEIEYLESNGTQYIDTLYKPNGKTRIKVKGRYTHPTLTLSDSMHFLFGVRDGSTFYDMLWNYYKTSQNSFYDIYLHYGTDTAKWFNNDINKDVEVDLSYEGGYYNGEKKLTVIHTASQSNYSLYLLWCNIDGVGQATRKPYGRMYYCKIYENNSLVLDLIPVRVGNVGYMYDKVSGQLFGNAGTGSFTLGQDVAPGRYANEVAFLESWGNQYIDTGIMPSTDTKIELKCLYCKSGAGLTSYGALIGADDRSNAYILNHSAVANFTYGLEFSNNFANPQTRLLTFDSTASPQNMRVYDEGGSLVTTLTCIRGVFEVNQNLYLFAVNRNGTPVYGSNRILYCKIYDGDTLVRDYVPVEYNGIGYMYDKVSGLFFDNQGTGKFLFGSIAKACARSYTRRQLMADTVLPKPYISNGLVFHLDGADATNTTWTDRVAGIVYTLQGASADGKGVTFSSGNDNTGRGTGNKALQVINPNVGTIEVCAWRRSSRPNPWKEFLYITAGLPAIQYVVDGSGTFVYISNRNSAPAPRMPINGKTLEKFTHSCNAARSCYNGTMVEVGSNACSVEQANRIAGDGAVFAFKGTIYQIRIYNRQLSEAEMKFNQEQDRKKYGIQF